MARVETGVAPRSEDELRSGAKLIRYERFMLAEAARLWSGGLEKDLRPNRTQRRMVTEVFLLHARNLLDFISPRPNSHSADVLARHYASSWACSRSTQLANRPITEWRNQIDKLLSHVTYKRQAIIESISEEPRWPLDSLYRDLTGKIDEFLATLPKSRRTWFED